MTNQELYDSIAATWLTRPGITTKKMFASVGLAAGNGKVFAMLCRNELVIKITAGRVDDLEATGIGRRFHSGPNRPMREWLSVDDPNPELWRDLIDEAHAHTAGPNR